jgi:hypothetical protein
MPMKASQLEAFTWETHYSFEPLEPFRETISVRFSDTHAMVTVTARYGELPGQGENAKVSIDIPITLIDGSFTIAAAVTVTSKPNSQGKVAKFAAAAGGYPFSIDWGLRGAAFFGREYQAVARPSFGRDD